MKHFIARWPRTQQALADSPDWTFLAKEDAWQLYELTTHDGRHVFVPEYEPIGVHCSDWQAAGLEWIYTPTCLKQHFAFLRTPQPMATMKPLLEEQDFIARMTSERNGSSEKLRGHRIDRTSMRITDELVTDNRIRFKTNAPGLPHIIKCTYYPNWKVRGADRVYMVSPCFMLVYPHDTQVELYYGRTFSDNTGRFLTCLGAALLLSVVVKNRLSLIRKRQRAG